MIAFLNKFRFINLNNQKMETIIFSFFFLVILLFSNYKSFIVKKIHLKKVMYYRKKIKQIKSKKNVLDTKFETNVVNKNEVDDLAKQVLDLHKLILESKIK